MIIGNGSLKDLGHIECIYYILLFLKPVNISLCTKLRDNYNNVIVI